MVLRNPLTYIWLFLVLTTCISWWLGAGGADMQSVIGSAAADLVVTLGIMLIAAVKVRLVVRHFMEVCQAALWLRLTLDVWLVALVIITLTLYWVQRAP